MQFIMYANLSDGQLQIKTPDFMESGELLTNADLNDGCVKDTECCDASDADRRLTSRYFGLRQDVGQQIEGGDTPFRSQ